MKPVTILTAVLLPFPLATAGPFGDIVCLTICDGLARVCDAFVGTFFMSGLVCPVIHGSCLAGCRTGGASLVLATMRMTMKGGRRRRSTMNTGDTTGQGRKRSVVVARRNGTPGARSQTSEKTLRRLDFEETHLSGQGFGEFIAFILAIFKKIDVTAHGF